MSSDLTDEEKLIIQRAADLCTVNPLQLTSEQEQIMKEFFQLSTSADEDKKQLITKYSEECSVSAMQTAPSTEPGDAAPTTEASAEELMSKYNGGVVGGIFVALCSLSCCALIIMAIVTAATDVEDEANPHFASFNTAWIVMTSICGVSCICFYVMHECSVPANEAAQSTEYHGGRMGRILLMVCGWSCCALMIMGIILWSTDVVDEDNAHRQTFFTVLGVMVTICVGSCFLADILHEIGKCAKQCKRKPASQGASDQ